MSDPEDRPPGAPKLVRATEVTAVEGGLSRYRFPGGFECLSHAKRLETEILYNEVFVAKEYVRFGVDPADAPCVVDVGANIGLFSLFARGRNPGGAIHAFEPIPETFSVLQANLRLHGIEGVRLYPCALGEAQAEAERFVYHPNLPASSSSNPEVLQQQRQALRRLVGPAREAWLLQEAERFVPVRTLSEWMETEGIGRIDYLKIDVEGGELGVLRGIAPEHYERIQQVAVEVHGKELMARVPALLRQMGLEVHASRGMASTQSVYGLRAAV